MQVVHRVAFATRDIRTQVAALIPLDDLVVAWESDTVGLFDPSFDEHLDALHKAGFEPLERRAKRAAWDTSPEDLRSVVSKLPKHVLSVLHSAQRHAIGGVVLGAHAWDPDADAGAIRHLHGAELLLQVQPGGNPYEGLYRIPPGLPAPPPIAYDWDEAVMDLTDDLSSPTNQPLALLHDLASLAAAIHVVRPRRTLSGTLRKTDEKTLTRHLGSPAGSPRWAQALQALEALGVVSTDPIGRDLFLDLTLEQTLEGEPDAALDRFLHRLVERDLHTALPAVRSALQQAGDGAIDEMIFLDELRLQHRDVLFPPWHAQGIEVYPYPGGVPERAYDEDGWERVEGRMIEALLRRLERLGLVRRAPGVFAPTEDGKVWASLPTLAPPPVWLTSDLELIVSPGAVTPWERFQLERLGRCVHRDVVDRYRVERPALRAWLATHELQEAIDLLKRRAAGVSQSVLETLYAWQSGFTRVVITRGVLREG